ncbi:MAG: sugar phosphate isomerase/epimerase [Planctomycetaceae bacterium]|jgi:D-psicose/D-tagatose/L-ribulose 3-epimerase|nr:sugar phosphate isomerase/epimerase [Planctomycetaceae bacterium]
MPKFGINLLLWTDTLTEEMFPQVEKLKTMGYDVVELPMLDKEAVANCAEWGRKLDDMGLLRTGTCAYGPEDNMISGDPKIRRQGIDTNKKILDCCAAAGCSVMAGDSYSALGVFTGKEPSSDEWKRGVEGMKEVAEHAGKVGVKIAIEALNRFECYMINCAADGSRFVREVGSPHCGMMYDTFHAHIEEKNIPDAIRSLKDSLIHVHISENDRSTPGSGNVRWRENFDTLYEIGYEGYMVCEAFSASLPKLTAATKIWRRMYESEEQLARDALAFMKREVGKRWK